jgi:hypothetical protein
LAVSGVLGLQAIPDASKAAPFGFVTDSVKPGATVRTDGWPSDTGQATLGYTHDPFNVSASGQPAHVALPGVHRVASLFERSLLNATPTGTTTPSCTCRPTATSGCSASTGAAHGPTGCCSCA